MDKPRCVHTELVEREYAILNKNFVEPGTVVPLRSRRDELANRNEVEHLYVKGAFLHKSKFGYTSTCRCQTKGCSHRAAVIGWVQGKTREWSKTGLVSSLDLLHFSAIYNMLSCNDFISMH